MATLGRQGHQSATELLEQWCQETGYEAPEYNSRYFQASVTVAGRVYKSEGFYPEPDELAARLALEAIQVDCKYGAMPPPAYTVL